ncbi:MAG: M20 family metallopeptidase [Asgard group archaeon]|nr:M20 family metallopeptidase [Asgard group archaeon]
MKIEKQDVIPILKKLINIKTENPPGFTIEAVQYLSNIFNEVGIKNRIQAYGEKRANIIAEYGEGEKTIILTGHLDTIPAGDETKWKFPPFSGKEEEGRIYGRGSTDMKGAIAAYVAVMTLLKQKNVKLSKKVIFLGTSDEELNMDGSLFAKNEGIMEGCEFVVIGEPTELKIGVAEKGTLWIKIRIEGKSAHGSTPHLGVSAIEAAAKLIPDLKEVVPAFEHKILGKSSLNIGKISGGTVVNVVPELCEIECDFRLVADDLRDEIKEKFNAVLNKFNQEEEAKASFAILHELPAIEMKYVSKFLEDLKIKAKKAGAAEIIGVNYGTDGAMLVPDYGTPFVIMGPGKLDQLHVTDEYTEIEEVIDYANIIYEALIDNFSVT